MDGAESRKSRRERGEFRLEVGAPRGEDVFRNAERHSGRVRLLRRLLPALVLAGGLGFYGTSYLMPQAQLLLAGAKFDLGTKSVVMDNPRVSGFHGTERSYELQADRAVQSLENPKVMKLEKIDARLGLKESGGSALLDASRGTYDAEAELLKLSKDISIRTASGYDVRLDEAEVDLKGGKLTSATPVEIRSGDTTIRSNALEISNGGSVMVFRNGVSVTYAPAAPGAGAK